MFVVRFALYLTDAQEIIHQLVIVCLLSRNVFFFLIDI